MSKNDFSWLKYITEIQAIAQNGLTYSTNEFDKERYLRLREIAAECMAYYSDSSLAEIKEIFSIEKGYATPKIDVRAFILQNNKLLLVKERADGLWTLPGGWAETNESAAESVIREAKEETGFDVSVIRLLALWDKQKHEHPLQWPHTYKCFFHCEIMSGKPKKISKSLKSIFLIQLIYHHYLHLGSPQNKLPGCMNWSTVQTKHFSIE